MATCADMSVGDVYTCASCGLEIEIKKACTCSTEDCGCSDLSCCGAPMQKV